MMIHSHLHVSVPWPLDHSLRYSFLFSAASDSSLALLRASGTNTLFSGLHMLLLNQLLFTSQTRIYHASCLDVAINLGTPCNAYPICAILIPVHANHFRSYLLMVGFDLLHFVVATHENT